MRILAQNYRSGELALVEAPVPACRAGGVLVRTEYSLISAGTELMKVSEGKLSLIGKARARPDQVRTVLSSVRQQGLTATYRKVASRLDSYTPLGYSLCGVVMEVGRGADPFEVGQRVACAGNQYALHAEVNWVPRNLCAAVPDNVAPEAAAFTTVGAIALQALRQSDARLGEIACVIGLGLLGQLLLQLLRAAGVKILGIDVVEPRCRLAEDMGAEAAGAPGTPAYDRLEARLAELSAGAGADHVFLTAGGSSNDPVERAAHLARDRARIVDVGKCRLDLPWKEYYEKELEVRFSRSYGPGRYDPHYEEEGIDYPIGYVRWTENRNMRCVLDLMADRRIDVRPLISAVHPFEHATDVYEALSRGGDAVGTLFHYPIAPAAERRVEAGSERCAEAIPTRANAPRDVVRLGVIGCGNYASSMLLPHLTGRSDVELVEVVTRSSLSAVNAVKKHGFRRMGTAHATLLAADDVDAVLILTRHASHAALVCDALRAGKTVFVEKPLAISEGQLENVIETVEETGNDRLLVGFNRRYAPLLTGLHGDWGRLSEPQVVLYRVNAGRVAADSWYADAAQHGTRFVGEGGHFIDTISWWLSSDPVAATAVHTRGASDNLVVTLRYPDGSVGIVTYLTEGDARYPKEQLEAFAGGAVARLDNFRATELWRGGRARRSRAWRGTDKGQASQMAAFIAAARSGGPMPIALASLIATTRATLAAVREADAPPNVSPAF